MASSGLKVLTYGLNLCLFSDLCYLQLGKHFTLGPEIIRKPKVRNPLEKCYYNKFEFCAEFKRDSSVLNLNSQYICTRAVHTANAKLNLKAF